MKRSIALWIVRLASFRAPPTEREALRTEWSAELLREVAAGGGWPVVLSALGAFADARARRQIDRAARTTRPDGVIAAWQQTLVISIRSLARSPGFAITAIVTLGIGLGSTAMMFTILDRVVFDPLPYPDAERLVNVENQVPGVAPDEIWWLSMAQWVYYTDHASDFEEIGIYNRNSLNVMTASGPVRARMASVTREVLPLVGAQTTLGRLLRPSDDVPEAELVAVVSHSFWRDQLGSDPAAVGSSLSLDTGPVAIVGVLSEDVRLPQNRFADAPEIWLPMRINRDGAFANSHRYQAIARLGPGSTPDGAQAALAELRARLPERFPDAYSEGFFEQYGFRTTVEPLGKSVVGETATVLWILFGGVALVLCIACANVTNLFLVRFESRGRELALRVALGAERADVVRYVLSDGLVLAAGGALLGLLLAAITLPTMIAFAPEEIPRLEDVALGLDSVLVTAGLALAVTLVISAWPIARAAVHRGGRGASTRTTSSSRGHARLWGTLISGQIALAVSLLVGSSLLFETVDRLHATDPGFNEEKVGTIEVFASPIRYPDDIALWGFHREIVERVGRLDGVVSVGMGEEVPVSGSYGCTVQGSDDESIYDRMRERGLTTCAGQTRVTPGYFETLDIPLLEGRLLEPADYADPNRASVVVSRALADRFWPGESPLGRGLGPGGRTIPPFFTIVGVVGDVAKEAADGRPPFADPAIAVYYPGVYPETENRWGGWWPGRMRLVFQTAGDPSRLFAEVRRVIHDIDPEAPVTNPQLMEEIVGDATSELTFVSLLLVITAMTALLLTAVGLYGAVSWVVGRRTREIGTRLAIGAHPGSVVRQVLFGTARLALIGLVLGLPLALLTSRAGQSVLVGVSPTEPRAYLAGVVAILGVTLAAAWIPARRAAGVDPSTALRSE